MISYLQKELRAAVGLTEMGSSTIFHHTDNNNNKRDWSLNISDDRSNRKVGKDGEDEFDDLNVSSILNVTGMSADGKTDVLSQLAADYDSIHHNVDIPTSTPFLAPRGEDGLPNDTGTATSPLLSTRLFSTTTTTKDKEKKKKKKKTTKNKNKKKSGYVGSMRLRGATADEENEMIAHGELL
jgi:hypothetical protein